MTMSFRLTLTAAVLLIVSMLAATLLFLQVHTANLAAEEAANSAMDAVGHKTLSMLEAEIVNLSKVVRTLSAAPSLADSSERSEVGRGVRLLKDVLAQWPGTDSVYVGYENGTWLQVQRLQGMGAEQRARLRAPADAAFGITLMRPTVNGELPTRRVYEDRDGNELDQLNIWRRGYDARQRGWYIEASESEQLTISEPYLSFSLAVPMLTISAPLQGRAHGVVGLDLKLDSYSASAQVLQFSKKGSAVVFNGGGKIIAHSDYGEMFARTMTDPRFARLPNIDDLEGSLEKAVLADWRKTGQAGGKIRWSDGQDYFFRVESAVLNHAFTANLLLIANGNEFATDIRELNSKARMLGLLTCLLFIPAAWFVGSRMSTTLKSITCQAERLQGMTTPSKPIGSFVKELNTLGMTIYQAQRAVWSFSRLAPREIVRRVMDGTISTELGGSRQEITAFFTDVQGFTTLSENADPDVLMRQTSRYFTVLTEVILEQGGTIDKFIGDGVMAFWNAPNPQADHCDRACRAALLARKANARINGEFEAEGLPPFYTRYGIHVGEAVVGNLGSSERMNYTALGSIVNLAARLEGLNKEHGTDILISEAVYERVRERFHCRFVGCVVAKGMVAETRIYQLLGELPWTHELHLSRACAARSLSSR
jgi:adenylate cyclase